MKKISLDSLAGLKKSATEGLVHDEVIAQRSRYGPNEIVEVTGKPWLELTLDTLKDPMIWFLVSIGFIFTVIGDKNEAIILFAAILPLVFMDAFLHWRTQASTATLKSQLSSNVTVIRDANEIQINSDELVPGDLLVVSQESFLSADGIFQNTSELQIDESALTGEALPISKHATKLNIFSLHGEVPVDPKTLGYAGTKVLTGKGVLRVLFTGKLTAYGEIVQSVSRVSHERTPLQKSIATLVQNLIYGAVFFCILLAGVRIYQGHGWLDALLSAATLAVAAIPEEFPVVFTFFLGVGVYRLAKRRALVRRSVSVENIGRITHICTDKTGTITIGLLSLTHLDGRKDLSEDEVLKTAFIASNPEGSDPVDLAIRELGEQKKIAPQKRLHTYPFTEDRKQETAIIEENGQIVAYMKGSPETILSKSNLSDTERLDWKKKTSRWAIEGHKVIACAKKKLSDHQEPQSNYEFCGLLAFEDPPRPEVLAAISYCERNRIKVLMLTGDHQGTAMAIAKDIGLGGSFPQVISAEEYPEKFEDVWLSNNPKFLRQLHAVARCTPLQKFRIVNALKKSGEIVAVTGDGVNDVPALKSADIGIAMGERGTRSAKEVASVVLADDNFSTIVSAIMEGKQLLTNLRMSFKYLLLIHIPLVLTAAIIPLLGYPILYLPIHIVWLELVIHPSALFAFQQKAHELKKPLQAQKKFFSTADTLTVFLTGAIMTAAITVSFIKTTDIGYARAKALALLTVWSIGVIFYFTKFKTKASIAVAAITLLSIIAIMEIPKIANIFHLKPLLQINDWIIIIAIVTATLFIKKITSKVCYQFLNQHDSDASKE